MEDPQQIDEAPIFDMGVSTIMRINYWLWRCNEAQFGDNCENWIKAVKIVYKECHAFMKDNERKEHAGYLQQTMGFFVKYLDWKNRYALNNNSRYPPREVFDSLLAWEMNLRQILDKKGLLMRKSENAGGVMV